MLIQFSLNAWSIVQLATSPLHPTRLVFSFARSATSLIQPLDNVFSNVLGAQIFTRIASLVLAQAAAATINSGTNLPLRPMDFVCSIVRMELFLTRLRWTVCPNVLMDFMARLSTILVISHVQRINLRTMWTISARKCVPLLIFSLVSLSLEPVWLLATQLATRSYMLTQVLVFAPLLAQDCNTPIQSRWNASTKLVVRLDWMLILTWSNACQDAIIKLMLIKEFAIQFAPIALSLLMRPLKVVWLPLVAQTDFLLIPPKENALNFVTLPRIDLLMLTRIPALTNVWRLYLLIT